MNSQINVKAHFNGNIRRFQSQALWTVFSKDLQALFSFDAPVVVQYRDDENDLCQISSQMELEFAASHFSTLHVFITKPEQVQTSAVVPVPSVPVKEECPKQLIDEVPAHFRGDRLAARLSFVQQKLESPALPAHRRAQLMMKKSKLEEALLRSPVEVPKQEMARVDAPEHTRKCRGRRDPSERLLAIEQALSNPNLPPKRMERLKLHKAKLEAFKSEVAPASVISSPAPEVDVPIRGPAARLLVIQRILAQPDLHPRRVERLTEKKAKLEQIIRDRSDTTPAQRGRRCREPTDRHMPESCEPKTREARRCHGHEDRKGRRCNRRSLESPAHSDLEAPRCRGPEARLATISKMLELTDLPPHRLQKLMNQKAKIEQRILDRADVSRNCGRGRRCRDQDLGCQKPRGARFSVVKRK